jgi:hypothetical protein
LHKTLSESNRLKSVIVGMNYEKIKIVLWINFTWIGYKKDLIIYIIKVSHKRSNDKTCLNLENCGLVYTHKFTFEIDPLFN